jgi:8-hydroxy-5-deazaflavin:NADPH oxidoreductase
MKTAVIGLGNIGSRLAKDLTTGGEKVILADRTLAKAEKLAGELGSTATVMPVADALGTADVVILAIPFNEIKELVATNHAALAGKIIIDPSNPIVPDGTGGFTKTIGPDQSAGELLAALIPGDAELVKAFGTVGADSLASGANRSPEHAALFYATDFPEAGRVAAKLITASGFVPVSVGGVAHSIRIEVGGDLHEYGKLGRLVSAKEAEALV